MTEILDESAVSEIEARKPFYFCDKCGYFGEAGPVHLKPGYEVDCSYNAVRPASELTIDVLCATVRHLEKQSKAKSELLEIVAQHAESQLEQLRADAKLVDEYVAEVKRELGMQPNSHLSITLERYKEKVATVMRSACVEKVRRKARQSETTGFHITDREAKAKLHIEANVLYEAAKELETLSIEQPKE